MSSKDNQVEELKEAEKPKEAYKPKVEIKEEQKFGVIMCLFLHSDKHNKLMKSVTSMQLVAGKGILNNHRYYETINKSSGYPNKNHLSIIEREQIAEHEEDIGKEILPGVIRSNIEIYGLVLTDFIGYRMKIGDTAIINVYKARVTCKQMDDIYRGLRKITKNEKLGVIAEIEVSGEIKIGDKLIVLHD